MITLTQKMTSKIVDDLVVEPVNAKATERVNNIMAQLGDYGVSWVWSMNWSNNDPVAPPSGFSLVVDYDAPLIPDPFHADKLFSGVSAFKIPQTITIGKDRVKLDETYLRKNHEEILNSMKRNLKPNTSNVFDLSCMGEESGGVDSKGWDPLISGTNSFAGIYSTKSRDGYFLKTDHWILVQSGVPEASFDIYKKICEKSDSDNRPTWNSFFNNNKDIAYTMEGSKRNRNRLIARVAKSMGLNIVCDYDQKCSKIDQKCIKPSLEMFHFSFTDVRSNKNIIYHANTVSPATSNGTLLMENPFIGGYIMNGDTDINADLPFGGHWTVNDKYGEAFPTCTGRRIDNETLNRRMSSRMVNDLMEKVIKLNILFLKMKD